MSAIILRLLSTRLGIGLSVFAAMSVIVGLMGWQISRAYDEIVVLSVKNGQLMQEATILEAQRASLQRSLTKQNTEVAELSKKLANASTAAKQAVKETQRVVEKRSPTATTDNQEYNKWLESLY